MTPCYTTTWDLTRWRNREGTEASARDGLEVVCVAYLFARLRTEPT